MKTIETHGTFEQAIAESEPDARELASRLRDLIVEVFPEVVEVPWPTQRVVGYGVGPKKMSEHFGYIGAHQRHVNLGFNYGADLPDPEGLLQGTGKKFRHIKLQSREDLDEPALRELLKASVEERQAALAAKG